MAEDARAARAGRGRHVTRFPEQREKAEERERQGLLRLTVEEDAIERHDGAWRDTGREELDEAHIAGAPAGEHEVIFSYPLPRAVVIGALLSIATLVMLIGAIVLEDLDFLVDCTKLCLVPRDPDYKVSEIE